VFVHPCGGRIKIAEKDGKKIVNRQEAFFKKKQQSETQSLQEVLFTVVYEDI